MIKIDNGPEILKSDRFLHNTSFLSKLRWSTSEYEIELHKKQLWLRKYWKKKTSIRWLPITILCSVKLMLVSATKQRQNISTAFNIANIIKKHWIIVLSSHETHSPIKSQWYLFKINLFEKKTHSKFCIFWKQLFLNDCLDYDEVFDRDCVSTTHFLVIFLCECVALIAWIITGIFNCFKFKPLIYLACNQIFHKFSQRSVCCSNTHRRYIKTIHRNTLVRSHLI